MKPVTKTAANKDNHSMMKKDGMMEKSGMSMEMDKSHSMMQENEMESMKSDMKMEPMEMKDDDGMKTKGM